MKAERDRRHAVLALVAAALLLALTGVVVFEAASGANRDEGASTEEADRPGETADFSVEDARGPVATEDGEAVSSYRTDEEAGLTEVAARVLEDYRDEGNCLLRRSGYLDLLGNVWGCVVEGPDWVDVVVVRELTSECCSKRVVRMRPDAWATEFEGLDR